MIELLLEAERALGKGRIDQAEYLYRQASIADPRNSIAVVGLGRVALERDDEVEAWHQARRALEIDPENAAAIRMVEVLEDVWRRGGRPLPGTEPLDVVEAGALDDAGGSEPGPETAQDVAVAAEAEISVEPDVEPQPVPASHEARPAWAAAVFQLIRPSAPPEPEPAPAWTAEVSAADEAEPVAERPPESTAEEAPVIAAPEAEPETPVALPAIDTNEAPASIEPQTAPFAAPEAAHNGVEDSPAGEGSELEQASASGPAYVPEAPFEPEPEVPSASAAVVEPAPAIADEGVAAFEAAPEREPEGEREPQPEPEAEPEADVVDEEVPLDASVVAAAHAWEAAVAGVAEPEAAIEELADARPGLESWPAIDLDDQPLELDQPGTSPDADVALPTFDEPSTTAQPETAPVEPPVDPWATHTATIPGTAPVTEPQPEPIGTPVPMPAPETPPWFRPSPAPSATAMPSEPAFASEVEPFRDRDPVPAPAAAGADTAMPGDHADADTSADADAGSSESQDHDPANPALPGLDRVRNLFGRKRE